MVYKILMPQLSDSMEEGKLILWKVKVHDKVDIGDVIAEVESDKAIMEVQCFKKGEIQALLIEEGQSAPLGTVIATIKIKDSAKQEDEVVAVPLKEDSVEQEEVVSAQENIEIYDLQRAIASPKAKVLAKKKDLNIHELQEDKKLPRPSHAKDIQIYEQRHFFTLKALHLLEKYKISTDAFERNKKYDSKDVYAYIHTEKLMCSKPVSSFQKAVIKNVKKSFEKPVFHIYDHIDTQLIQSYAQYSISAWLVNVFASVMMEFEGFRSRMDEDNICTYVNASVSFAMLGGRQLYMPVIKDANLLSIQEIQEALKSLQLDINEKSIQPEQMHGSSFGLSNLGNTGIERFDALINQDDSAIAAIGSNKDNKIAITLTLDHRLIDGYEAALFMQKLKSTCLDEEFFKRKIENV